MKWLLQGEKEGRKVGRRRRQIIAHCYIDIGSRGARERPTAGNPVRGKHGRACEKSAKSFSGFIHHPREIKKDPPAKRTRNHKERTAKVFLTARGELRKKKKGGKKKARTQEGKRNFSLLRERREKNEKGRARKKLGRQRSRPKFEFGFLSLWRKTLGMGYSLSKERAVLLTQCSGQAVALSRQAIQEYLDTPELQGWQLHEKRAAIKREFAFEGFDKAWKFMEDVAAAAAKADHHPDWRNRYSTVWITLETHVCGGVSMRDIAMAQFCNECFEVSKSGSPPVMEQASGAKKGPALKKASTWSASTEGGAAESDDNGAETVSAAAPAAQTEADEEVAPEEPESGESSLAAADGKSEEQKSFAWPDATREKLTPERAQELIKPLVESSNFKSVFLCGKSFDAAAIAPVADAIRKQENLSIVDFSDIIAGQEESVALDALRAISDTLSDMGFESLNLSDNALGEKGVQACAALLRNQQQSLRRLWCDNDGLSKGAVAVLVEMLLGDADKLPLELLHLHNNMMGNGGGKALGPLFAKCPEISDIRVSGTRMFDKGTTAIFRALDESAAAGIQRLDFGGTTIGDGAIQFAENVVRRSKQLAYVNFADTMEEELAVRMLVALRETACKLTDLNMSATNLTTDEGLDALKELLAQDFVRDNLVTLRLNDNDEFESDGLVGLAEAFSETFPSVEVVEVNCCCASGNGALAIAKVLSAKCPKLRLLDLSGNTVSESTVAEINSLFGESVKVSWVDNEPDDDEDVDSDAESDDDDDEN
jgi:Ran GTPase-activating protein 1